MLNPAVGELGSRPSGDVVRLGRHARPLAVAVLSGAVATALWFVAQFALLGPVVPEAIATNLDGRGEALWPGDPIQVTLTAERAELQGVHLFRSEQSDAGERREVPVAVRAEPLADATWQVQPTSGATLLRPDGSYRLVVQASVPRAALPFPRSELVERQYRFDTVPSPQPALPADTLRPRWAEPVALRWSTAMRALAVSVQPEIPARAWVDEQDPTRTWVQLGGEAGAGLLDGRVYDVLITSAVATDGIELQRPAGFSVAIPERPRILDAPAGPVTLRRGETLTLAASTALASVRAKASDDTPLSVQVEGRSVAIALPGYRQGASFTVEFREAVSREGAPLAEPVRLQVQTPAAFAAPKIEPEHEARRVDPNARPAVTFAGPVADRAAAERAITLEPAVDGEWTWAAPDRIEFVPDGRLPFLTDFTITIASGPDGPRSAAGGYLEQDAVAAFRTTHYKKIEVDISEQRLYMLEDGQVVRTIVVGTGVPGADTPIGEFQVEYKMRQARFQGVNPSGKRYDIPDVNWILPFWGDYSIHGAYWRSSFGTPGSNGCVGMPDAEAKIVYDWADVGTPVSIRM